MPRFYHQGTTANTASKQPQLLYNTVVVLLQAPPATWITAKSRQSYFAKNNGIYKNTPYSYTYQMPLLAAPGQDKYKLDDAAT
jgi:hypothetical protein